MSHDDESSRQYGLGYGSCSIWVACGCGGASRCLVCGGGATQRQIARSIGSLHAMAAVAEPVPKYGAPK